VARELEEELQEYSWVLDNDEYLRNMCVFLDVLYSHIDLCVELGIPTAFQHPDFDNRLSADEILRWSSEANLASSYNNGYISDISDEGKVALLEFGFIATSMIYQTPDIFRYIGSLEAVLMAYGLTHHIDYETVQDVTDWELDDTEPSLVAVPEEFSIPVK
jgi:hypothetical protein